MLVEQSEAQRNMHVGVVHVDDFESLPASESDDLHSGQDLHFGPFLSSTQLNDVHMRDFADKQYCWVLIGCMKC